MSIRRPPATLFDAYLFLDWSANSRPKSGKDSIWAADGWFAGDSLGDVVLHNPKTRLEAERWLHRRLELHRDAGRRALVGVDFPLGYPAGTLGRLFPAHGDSWRALWQHLASAIRDGDRNENNRFEVARALNQAAGELWYWGCPRKATADGVASTKAGRGAPPEYRLVEQKLRAAGRRPFSVWQLLGSGAVGSQTLLGLPLCERLRARVDSVAVWPFETGLRCPARSGGAAVVICEIWPGVIDVSRDEHAVRDAAQMLSYVRAAASRDASGTLAQWFDPPGLDANERELAEAEGWILGFVPTLTWS